MKRADDSRFLLYMEPNKHQKSIHPNEDELTWVMDTALRIAKLWKLHGCADYSNTKGLGSISISNCWKGRHVANDGTASTNRDYVIPGGYIVNSLCAYYMRWYRDCVPESELNKVKEVYELLKTKK